MDMNNEKHGRVIADLTRTRYGLERSIVKLVKRYCDENNVEKSTLYIVVTPTQRQYVTPDFAGATLIVSPGTDAKQAIIDVVRSVTDREPIRLLSYGRDVLELDREDSRLKSLSFGRYRLMSRPLNQPQREDAAIESVSQVASPVSAVAEVEATHEAAAAAEPKRPVYRSEVFQGILIKRRLGPFPDHRPLVYDAIEQLIEGDKKVRVSELFQLAVAEAKAKAADRNKAAGREPRVDDRLWAGIAKFSEQLFLEAKALIGSDGEALGMDWKATR